MTHQNAVIAANRFGMGVRPGDLDKAKASPEEWLLKQLVLPEFSPSQPGSGEVMQAFYDFRRDVKRFKQQKIMEKPENPGRKVFFSNGF